MKDVCRESTGAGLEEEDEADVNDDNKGEEVDRADGGDETIYLGDRPVTTGVA